jgi:hypothetical protein
MANRSSFDEHMRRYEWELDYGPKRLAKLRRVLRRGFSVPSRATRAARPARRPTRRAGVRRRARRGRRRPPDAPDPAAGRRR